MTLETTNDIRTVIADPLHHLEPLPEKLTCYPLGFPVTISTNSVAVLEAARESWGYYGRAFDTPSLELRALVQSRDAAAFPPPPVYRAQGHLMSIVANRDNYAVCDFHGNFAYCWIEPQVVESRAWMRHHFLEGMVYSTLSCRYLTAIHAACVMRQGRGLLLHGPSGTGKSCLSYACARHGWTYVSDDVCFLRRGFASRMVLGKPHQIRFLPSASALFSELAGRPVIPDAVGEPMMTLDTATLGSFQTSMQAPADAVVFLHRRESGQAEMRPMDREVAFELLLAELPLITQPSYEEQQESLKSLLVGPIVELRYSTLDGAVAALEEFAGRLEEPAS